MMTEPVDETTVGALMVRVYWDDCGRDARDLLGDTVGRVAGMGDYSFSDDPRETYASVRASHGPIVAIPIRVDSHGPEEMLNYGAHVWDNAQGFYWAPLSVMESEHFKTIGQLAQCLRFELATLDEIIRGEVYGYEVTTPTGEHVTSCWGFVGMGHPYDVNAEAIAAAEYAWSHAGDLIRSTWEMQREECDA